MEFLENAIFSSDTNELLGVMLTHYTPDDYTGRASVALHTLEKLQQEYSQMDPRGFTVGEGGVLLSDSDVRSTITDSVFTFVNQECQKLGVRDLDITDLVLLGVKCNGYVVVGYGQSDAGDAAPTLIRLSSFAVSKSSFNIYARYARPDDSFRTYSLLDHEYGDAKEIYVAFPADADLSAFGEAVAIAGQIDVGEEVYIVYKCNLGLSVFYVSVGEAFLNYLSYNIAFYNIGEDTLKSLRESVHPSPVYPKATEEVRVTGRPVRANVLIEHEYNQCRLPEVLACQGDSDKLIDLFSRIPDSVITYQWIQKVLSSPWYYNTRASDGHLEALYVAATNLLPECRQQRLKIALELLTHRYYIYSQGHFNDSTGILLKGGGVDGQSVKQSDFGNR